MYQPPREIPKSNFDDIKMNKISRLTSLKISFLEQFFKKKMGDKIAQMAISRKNTISKL